MNSPLTRVLVALALALVWSSRLCADERGPAGKPDPSAVSQAIDRAIDKTLQADKITPSARADDAEFLRRAYLDITGVIPSADKAAAFLDSSDPQKRAKLIDELLASPAYGRHMADIWQGLLVQADSNNRRVAFDALHGWLEKGFNENRAWDKFVTELVTASGPQNENGAVTFFLANPTPDKLTDQVSRLFLGVQLQCAQCHNHPFTSWKRDEYWGMAAFFFKVKSDRANQKNANALAVVETTATGKGKQAKLPDSARVVPAKFLQGDQPKLQTSEPNRPVLAKWMTSADNVFFAPAMVNRTWAHFFGRGFVNPIDDMHEGNPASHPELLKEMARHFAASGFDLKDLIRGICNSQAYQRTSKPTDANKTDVHFSHMSLKPMTPEQLYDSLTAVLGATGEGKAGNGKQAGGKRPVGNARTQFVNFFRADESAIATDYNAGIPQALRLMNAPQLNRGGALLDSAKSATPEQIIERLYLGTLARRPAAPENERMLAYVQKHKGEERKAYSDILWALLNSSEFVLNH